MGKRDKIVGEWDENVLEEKWKASGLFVISYQNMRVQRMWDDGILRCFRNLLPVKAIRTVTPICVPRLYRRIVSLLSLVINSFWEKLRDVALFVSQCRNCKVRLSFFKAIFLGFLKFKLSSNCTI